MSADEYMSENLWWFQFMGFKPKTESHFLVRTLQRAFRFFCNVFTISIVALSITGVAKKSNVEISMLNIAVYVGVFVRINYYYIFDERMVKIVEMMNSLFRSSSATGLVEKTMERYKQVSRAIVASGVVLDLFTSTVVLLIPIFKGTERTLPMLLWYPYDWTQSPYYELTYLTQFISQFIMGFTYFNADFFFMCVAFLTSGQIKILGWEFRNSLYHVLLENGISKETVEKFMLESNSNCARESSFSGIYKVLGTKKFRNDLRNHLTSLVRFHQKLLAFCDELESFFSPCLLLTIPNCISFTIFIGFALVMTDNTPLRLTLMTYLFTALFQVFWPTLFGHLLNEQFVKLRDHLYEIPWYLCDEKFKRDVRFVHLRTTKPFKVTVGKLADLNLTVYLWIVRTSFSYITVLLQVAENE